jgi:hypothetical protein
MNDIAAKILKEGSVRIRVKRTGMFQFQVFKVRKVKVGNNEFVELYLDRVLDMPEIHRVAAETGLPVEATNGRAFPEGTGATDFLV